MQESAASFVRIASILTIFTPVASQTACGGSLTRSGALSSPNYPAEYPSDTSCEWAISVTSGRAKLSFSAFDVEYSATCNYDKVVIRDGSSSGTILGTFCGSQVPNDVIATGSTLYVTFTSDGNEEKSGFSATFDSACGGNLTRSGVFSSPNYPAEYPSHASCEWTISVTSGRAKLSFGAFDVEDLATCNYDKVMIRDGSSSGTILGTFCGSEIPKDTIATGSTLYVIFTSDGSVQKSGFSATFDSACGGSLTRSGAFSSPNYPAEYPSDANCEWVIGVTAGRAKLSFSAFDVEDSATCNDDKVVIRDGSSSGTILGTFCGSKIPNDTIATGSTLYVTFTSDGNEEKSGFSAVFDSDVGKSAGFIRSNIAVSNYTHYLSLRVKDIDTCAVFCLSGRKVKDCKIFSFNQPENQCKLYETIQQNNSGDIELVYGVEKKITTNMIVDVEESSLYNSSTQYVGGNIFDGRRTWQECENSRDMFHSSWENHPWFRVELNSDKLIAKLIIWNRVGDAGKWTKNVSVMISKTIDGLSQYENQCVYHPGNIASIQTLRCINWKYGRFILVQLLTETFFNIYELEIYCV